MRAVFSLILGLFGALAGGVAAQAQEPFRADFFGRRHAPWILNDNTHLLALGDSLTAGYGAFPVTQGYAYLLYRDGVYDHPANTSFASSAVPGATSAQVLNFETPLAVSAGFLAQPAPGVTTKSPRRIVVMTVGGNDLIALLAQPNPTDPALVQATIKSFAANLAATIPQLCTFANIRIYIANLYDIRNFPIRITEVVLAFNGALQQVVDGLNRAGVCPNNVKIADVYSQFLGDQRGLLLINRPGADKFEVHPSDAGYRAMERAFIVAR